jgi:4-hydroxy-tetrahydrodipicolinate reductase
MLFLVLGKGKTGSLVAQVARERGHGVRALDITENQHASALTAPTLAGVDAVIDFTAPEYAHLEEMKSLAQKRGALLYGTNFSIGVQKLFRLTASLAQLDGYTFSISETHHVTKLDAPSGTAITLQQIVEAARPGAKVEITSHRVGDAKGEHIVRAAGPDDILELKHDANSRRGFALGAVRAAEWLAGKSGAWEFREIFDQL